MRKRQLHEGEGEREREERRRDARRLVLDRVRSLDLLYPKAEEEAFRPSSHGTALSLLVVALSLLLVVNATLSYFSVRHDHQVRVDLRPAQRVPIVFNVTFPRLQCSQTAIDVMDVSGEVQVDATSNVWRTRLSKEGQRIGSAFEDLHTESGEHRSDRKGEGCFISALLQVNKVAGNVHIALGSSHAHSQKDALVSTSKHMHSYQRPEAIGFDASHHIHTFAFGPLVPTISNPLDNTDNIIVPPATSAHFQYFIKIVPTVYTNSANHSVHTAQYSVTSQTHYISPSDIGSMDPRRVPGVFFIYDLSAFMVHINEKSQSFGSFLVSLCAIIGGVVTVAGVISSCCTYMFSTCSS